MNDDEVTYSAVILPVYRIKGNDCPRCLTNRYIEHPQAGYVCLACLDICIASLHVPKAHEFEEGVMLYCQMYTPRSAKGN